MGRLGIPNTPSPLYNERNSKESPNTTKSQVLSPETPEKKRKVSLMTENPREIGWYDSSDLDNGEDVEELQESLTLQTPNLDPQPTHAPVVSLEPEFFHANRVFWEKCLVGLLIDSRKFKVIRMQSIIDHYCLTGTFEDPPECGSVGSTLELTSGIPNLSNGGKNRLFARGGERNRLGTNILEKHSVLASRDSNPNPYPLLMGVILRTDVGNYFWIQCHFERIFRICKGCGRIGHLPHDCDCSREQVDVTLDAQRQWIQDQYGNAYGIMVDQAYFIPDARIFKFQPSRRTTHIIALYTRNGYHYRLHRADSVDFYFDPWVPMDAHRNMDPPAQIEVENEESQEPEESLPEQALDTQPDFKYHQHEQVEIPTI
ncbi:Zinc knuckle CX2CX4HX4C [Senna tora]|uniref:Zinc knuckle CX2CX4HX4C n=1 Tax=Senna tora TaxID=362788 RepID=A0A834W3G3_9FABA|nr:Zinc knuckle CX2CX4HX4C [Senna tora]